MTRRHLLALARPYRGAERGIAPEFTARHGQAENCSTTLSVLWAPKGRPCWAASATFGMAPFKTRDGRPSPPGPLAPVEHWSSVMLATARRLLGELLDQVGQGEADVRAGSYTLTMLRDLTDAEIARLPADACRDQPNDLPTPTDGGERTEC